MTYKNMNVYRRCCICGRLIEGDTHDARPYKKGECCGVCYANIVIPAKSNYRTKRWKY